MVDSIITVSCTFHVHDKPCHQKHCVMLEFHARKLEELVWNSVWLPFFCQRWMKVVHYTIYDLNCPFFVSSKSRTTSIVHRLSGHVVSVRLSSTDSWHWLTMLKTTVNASIMLFRIPSGLKRDVIPSHSLANSEVNGMECSFLTAGDLGNILINSVGFTLRAGAGDNGGGKLLGEKKKCNWN